MGQVVPFTPRSEMSLKLASYDELENLFMMATNPRFPADLGDQNAVFDWLHNLPQDGPFPAVHEVPADLVKGVQWVVKEMSEATVIFCTGA